VICNAYLSEALSRVQYPICISNISHPLSGARRHRQGASESVTLRRPPTVSRGRTVYASSDDLTPEKIRRPRVWPPYYAVVLQLLEDGRPEASKHNLYPMITRRTIGPGARVCLVKRPMRQPAPTIARVSGYRITRTASRGSGGIEWRPPQFDRQPMARMGVAALAPKPTAFRSKVRGADAFTPISSEREDLRVLRAKNPRDSDRHSVRSMPSGRITSSCWARLAGDSSGMKLRPRPRIRFQPQGRCRM